MTVKTTIKTKMLVAGSALLLSAGTLVAAPATTETNPGLHGCMPMDQPLHAPFMEPTYHYRCGMGQGAQVQHDQMSRTGANPGAADHPQVSAPAGLRRSAGSARH